MFHSVPALGEKRCISRVFYPVGLRDGKKIEVRGISDTAHRVRSTCLRVLRYAARTGRPHNVNSDDLWTLRNGVSLVLA